MDSGGRRTCGICLEPKPADTVTTCTAAGQPAAAAAAAAARFGAAAFTRSQQQASGSHSFCLGCTRQYVCVKLAAQTHPPLACPSPGCRQVLADGEVQGLLAGSWELQVFQRLQVEAAIPASLRCYCPHRACSYPLQRAAGQPLQASLCPQCKGAFCPSCLIPGWHQGFTCAQFQALPADKRSAEDAAMLKLMADMGWKACPACGIVVERLSGCNHMHCRCGVDFCYCCGLRNEVHP